MQRRAGFELKTWVFYHNAMLSLGSAVILCGILYELAHLNLVDGFPMSEIYCSHRSHKYAYCFPIHLMRFDYMSNTVFKLDDLFPAIV